MAAPSSPTLTKVFVLDPRGVRQAALVETIIDRRGRERCRVQVRGDAGVRKVDPALVFTDEAEAREQWRRARGHQAELERAGCHIRVVDAHLSLAIAERVEA